MKVFGWKARPRRRMAARAGKSHWLATVLACWEARSAIEATGEPSVIVSRNQATKIPDERWLPGRRASIALREGPRGVAHIRYV